MSETLGITCPVCGTSMYLAAHLDEGNEEILHNTLVKYLLYGRKLYKGSVTPVGDGWHAITKQTHDSPDGDSWLKGVARFNQYGGFEVRIGEEAYAEAMRPIWQEQRKNPKESSQ